MFGLGMWELLAILVVVIVLFGAKRIPALAKGVGQGVRNLKKELKGSDDDKPKLE
jgi:sec-independent protein translocase protein TatA